MVGAHVVKPKQQSLMLAQPVLLQLGTQTVVALHDRPGQQSEGPLGHCPPGGPHAPPSGGPPPESGQHGAGWPQLSTHVGLQPGAGVQHWPW
jgi:hypothetical protein